MKHQKDRYRTFAELKNEQREETDFRIRVTPRSGASTVIVAPHGGGIEPGTSEIARAVAGEDFSLALFEGTRTEGNAVLHITSTGFDEPQCDALVREARQTLAIHGENSEAPVIFLGGKDAVLGSRIQTMLEKHGYAVKRHESVDLQGTADQNICNRNLQGAGVQLELSHGLRRTFFQSLNAAGRAKPTAELQRFADALRAGLQGTGDT